MDKLGMELICLRKVVLHPKANKKEKTGNNNTKGTAFISIMRPVQRLLPHADTRIHSAITP